MTAGLPEKVCARCGRRFSWRRKWQRNWEQVRYCSERCRRSNPTHVDRELERAIITLLGERPRGATICPSEAARVVRPGAWRGLMPQTRSAARRLAADGRITILQSGRAVDPSTAKGASRLRVERLD